MSTRILTMKPLFATLALFALLLTGCGGDDGGPTSPTPTGETGPVVLLLGDGGSEAHVKAVLEADGFDVRDGGLFHEFTGAGLDEVDAVVLLAGVDYNHDMDDTGEAALVAFVQSGGGLVTTEWLSYSIDRTEFHRILAPILPVSYGGSYASGSETYTVVVDHPVTENVPVNFATGDDSQFSTVAPRSGATQLVRGNRSGAAVVTWTQGGRVVSWNMAGEYGGENVWNAFMDRLLTGAVGFVSHR